MAAIDRGLADSVWFYGVGPEDSAGHYWWAESSWYHSRKNELMTLPSSLRAERIDGKLQPGCELVRGHWESTRPQVQGEAVLHFIDGWTVLCFWDRSGDSRLGSSANFAVRGQLSFEQMCARSKTAWPKLWARFRFDVRLAGSDVTVAAGGA